MPEAARFDGQSTQSKHLLDTVKMIAYRAETAMVQIVRQKMTRHDDARRLLRANYSTEVDILPNPQAKTSPSASTRLPTNPPTMPSTKPKHYSPEPSYA